MIRIDRQKAFDTARECPTRCAIIQVGYTYALYA